MALVSVNILLVSYKGTNKKREKDQEKQIRENELREGEGQEASGREGKEKKVKKRHPSSVSFPIKQTEKNRRQRREGSKNKQKEKNFFCVS